MINPEDLTEDDKRYIAASVVSSFGAILDDERAINLVTIKMVSKNPALGAFDVTIQRSGKKSTAEIMQEQGERIKLLEDALVAYDTAARKVQEEVGDYGSFIHNVIKTVMLQHGVTIALAMNAVEART